MLIQDHLDSWQSFCSKQFCLFCLFLSVFGKMSDCQILKHFVWSSMGKWIKVWFGSRRKGYNGTKVADLRSSSSWYRCDQCDVMIGSWCRDVSEKALSKNCLVKIRATQKRWRFAEANADSGDALFVPLSSSMSGVEKSSANSTDTTIKENQREMSHNVSHWKGMFDEVDVILSFGVFQGVSHRSQMDMKPHFDLALISLYPKMPGSDAAACSGRVR